MEVLRSTPIEINHYMQGAAGTFQMLQEQVFAHLQTSPTPDLSAECTTALVQLMLAQAQECFCIKAAKGVYGGGEQGGQGQVVEGEEEMKGTD